MKNILVHLRHELALNADEKSRLSGMRFFKEQVEMYGIKTAKVIQIGKKYYQQISTLNKNEVFALCTDLWQSGMMEESFIACNWAYEQRKKYEPSDLKLFVTWIKKYVNNWASCDTLCNHIIGSLIEQYPELIEELKKWAKSDHLWLKRASAVSLIVPARKGMFLDDVFEIALILLLDPNDMVQKGYGWMLKVASQQHQKEVYNFVCQHKKVMPRTALRYAIEKMPTELRKKAMDK